MVFELFSFMEFLAKELYELFGQRTKHFGGNAKDGFELFSFTDFLAEERNIYYQNILVEMPRMVFELFSFTKFLAKELHELFGQRTKHFGGNAKDGFELFSFTDFLAEERNIYYQNILVEMPRIVLNCLASRIFWPKSKTLMIKTYCWKCQGWFLIV